MGLQLLRQARYEFTQLLEVVTVQGFNLTQPLEAVTVWGFNLTQLLEAVTVWSFNLTQLPEAVIERSRNDQYRLISEMAKLNQLVLYCKDTV